MTPTICRVCGEPIVRCRCDVTDNPNICPACENTLADPGSDKADSSFITIPPAVIRVGHSNDKEAA